MPISCAFKTKPISDDDFHALDYKVMGMAFAIHRELGRLWSEAIYQNELAYRCQKAGLERVAIEVPIEVSYQGFQKMFYVDLLINDAVIYELKTVQTLTGEHHQQTLTYLLLLGVQHGKLINLRPSSVEFRFVSTRLTPRKRYNYIIEDANWLQLDEDSIWLKKLLVSLLKEWGAFLDTSLFYDAIEHFWGGKENVVKKIEVTDGARVLGTQQVHLINSETGFKLSSFVKNDKYYENHLRRFVRYTSLKAIQWINFQHDRIVFKTILR